jgi:hypothetical protein
MKENASTAAGTRLSFKMARRTRQPASLRRGAHLGLIAELASAKPFFV